MASEDRFGRSVHFFCRLVCHKRIVNELFILRDKFVKSRVVLFINLSRLAFTSFHTATPKYSVIEILCSICEGLPSDS